MVLHTNTLKNNLISGTLLLTLTGILSRIIGFYYKIFLSRTIGAEGLGIYQLIFPVFALIIAVCRHTDCDFPVLRPMSD